MVGYTHQNWQVSLVWRLKINESDVTVKNSVLYLHVYLFVDCLRNHCSRLNNSIGNRTADCRKMHYRNDIQ